MASYLDISLQSFLIVILIVAFEASILGELFS